MPSHYDTIIKRVRSVVFEQFDVRVPWQCTEAKVILQPSTTGGSDPCEENLMNLELKMPFKSYRGRGSDSWHRATIEHGFPKAIVIQALITTDETLRFDVVLGKGGHAWKA